MQEAPGERRRDRPRGPRYRNPHVTLRVRDEVWNLRSRRCFRALARGFVGGKDRFGFRLYHAHVLRSPTEVARAVAYVLGNYFRHAAGWGVRVAHHEVDPYSSAAEHEKAWTGLDPALVVEPRTWLLRVGWERGDAKRRAG